MDQKLPVSLGEPAAAAWKGYSHASPTCRVALPVADGLGLHPERPEGTRDVLPVALEL